MPFSHGLNPDAFQAPRGTPYGFAGSKFTRPVMNEDFMSLSPETRLSLFQQFASGNELTDNEQAVMELLGRRVGNRKKRSERERAPAPQQESGVFMALLRSLNPFDRVADELQ